MDLVTGIGALCGIERMNINQLDSDDLQDIREYIFSVTNGNHILRYSEL